MIKISARILGLLQEHSHLTKSDIFWTSSCAAESVVLVSQVQRLKQRDICEHSWEAALGGH
jgi:hypothetical protein